MTRADLTTPGAKGSNLWFLVGDSAELVVPIRTVSQAGLLSWTQSRSVSAPFNLCSGEDPSSQLAD